MKNRYVFGVDFSDIKVTLDVDLDVLTLGLAKEINDFWSDSESVLFAADGYVIQAVARRAATVFIHAAFDGCSIPEAQARLDESEGWPPAGESGIRLVDFDIPDTCADSLDLISVEEVGGES
jgi:hypothetical protein